MTALETQRSMLYERGTRRDFPERRQGRARRDHGNQSSMLLAGVAIVGLGALAWYYLGNDVRRYIRIETM